jgi:FtsZ-interacting cell division protein YlmF
MKLNLKLGFLSKIFEGAIGIEKTYNQCDRAISKLREYNKEIESMQENNEDISSYPAAQKAELDKIVNEAITNAKQLLSKESERNWVGVFREMHKNLATIYVEQREYDKAREACEHLRQYGEVGQEDATEILQQLKEIEGGADDSPEEATESAAPA